MMALRTGGFDNSNIEQVRKLSTVSLVSSQ